MSTPDYPIAIASLQENLQILTDAYGHVAPEDRPIWNVSNALIVLLDAVRSVDLRLQSVEQKLQR